MSSMDYLCCKKCDGKIFYDAHDDLLDRLDDYFEGKGLLCPDCVEKVETEIAEARAEVERLKRIIDEMTEEQAALCAEGQSITELVAAKDGLVEQMREALKAIDGIGREAGNARREDALRCFSITAAVLAAERMKKK